MVEAHRKYGPGDKIRIEYSFVIAGMVVGGWDTAGVNQIHQYGIWF